MPDSEHANAVGNRGVAGLDERQPLHAPPIDGLDIELAMLDRELDRPARGRQILNRMTKPSAARAVCTAAVIDRFKPAISHRESPARHAHRPT